MADKKTSNPPQNDFIEWITVSGKGQISIPVEIRRELEINTGDQLLIILRKDRDGINLIKKEALDKSFEKFTT